MLQPKQKPKTKVKATPDSTSFFRKKEYVSSLKYGLANGLPEMKRQKTNEKQASLDKTRQANKGKAGYDKNGYPIKKK